MKNVILYIRVSTDEQADKGFSLRDQEQKLLNYCKLNNLNVLELFKEDYSAKTFNRPEFKRLSKYCKKNRKIIDELLFIKWDRFSRNTMQSYNIIDSFRDLGIVVNAIEQPLDLSIPEQGLMLAVYLSMPEVENQRRSLNVKAGMRRAFKEGRYVVTPPKGYSMGGDNNKKPILIPNPDAVFIQEAFEIIAKGIYNQKEVLTKLTKKGFKSSSSAFARILRNSLYYGDILIPAYKDEKEIVVKGVHEPLITKQLFNKVQKVINGGKKQQRTTHKKVNEKFPLKDFVLCPKCGNPLLASASKGRTKYYAYYHCTSPCGTRYKSEDVELWFGNFLGGISLKPNIQKLLLAMIKERFMSQTSHDRLGPKHYEAITKIEDKLIKLQDIYIDGGIDKSDYATAKERYGNILAELKEKETKQKQLSVILDTYKKGFKKLNGIDTQFFESNIENKRKLLGSIFPKKFQFEKNKVRTADINPLLLKIASVNRGLQRNKKRDKSKKPDLSQLVLKVGIEL
ncbi:recombinase family protein [Algibacter mikhailovii]|uniref:recombinase family protein n=1 Tax=Algibacter mikhailovii TaxID=425498 RepID=UPI002493F51B|nr:recombinase family protein [Algibacter mikhailovii]